MPAVGADYSTALARATGSTVSRTLAEHARALYHAGDMVINVKGPPYNAACDGVTDDYDAIQAVVAAVNAAGRPVRVVFPGGVCRIDQYRIQAPDAEANGITDFEFTTTHGVVIEGNGTKIDMKGDYHRTAYSGATSYRGTVGFRFADTGGLVIRDLEIDGNADQTTKDGGVNENNGGHGLMLYGVQGFALDNVRAHHFPVDGLYISGSQFPAFKVSRRGLITNSRFDHNGRQGCSIIQARWLTFIRSEFSYTGVTDGAYGGHAPQAGVDIEPNHWPDEPGYPGDEYTGDVAFYDCRFAFNAGAEYVGTTEVRTPHPVTFVGSTFEDTAGVGTTARVVPGTKRTRFVDCTFKQVALLPGYGLSAAVDRRTDVVSSRFTSATPSQPMLTVTSTTGEVVVKDCEWAFLGAAPSIGTERINCSGAGTLVFTGNTIWISGAEHRGDGTARDTKFILTSGRRVSGNVWSTDLALGAGEYFQVSVTSTLAVREEVFAQPDRWSHGTSGPANRSINETGLPYITTGSAAPISGTWARGDIVYFTSPSAGGKVGVVCTSGGTPGTWKPFGAIDP
jgi:hypothetical protein